jgi:hypothetical protein
MTTRRYKQAYGGSEHFVDSVSHATPSGTSAVGHTLGGALAGAALAHTISGKNPMGRGLAAGAGGAGGWMLGGMGGAGAGSLVGQALSHILARNDPTARAKLIEAAKNIGETTGNIGGSLMGGYGGLLAAKHLEDQDSPYKNASIQKLAFARAFNSMSFNKYAYDPIPVDINLTDPSAAERIAVESGDVPHLLGGDSSGYKSKRKQQAAEPIPSDVGLADLDGPGRIGVSSRETPSMLGGSNSPKRRRGGQSSAGPIPDNIGLSDPDALSNIPVMAGQVPHSLGGEDKGILAPIGRDMRGLTSGAARAISPGEDTERFRGTRQAIANALRGSSGFMKQYPRVAGGVGLGAAGLASLAAGYGGYRGLKWLFGGDSEKKSWYKQANGIPDNIGLAGLNDPGRIAVPSVDMPQSLNGQGTNTQLMYSKLLPLLSLMKRHPYMATGAGLGAGALGGMGLGYMMSGDEKKK